MWCSSVYLGHACMYKLKSLIACHCLTREMIYINFGFCLKWGNTNEVLPCSFDSTRTYYAIVTPLFVEQEEYILNWLSLSDNSYIHYKAKIKLFNVHSDVWDDQMYRQTYRIYKLSNNEIR